jgi:LacI family transcriptional regulator
MAVTIYDIAEKAGVSIATVSRVFNDSSSVSKRTRDRVLSIADEMGYHPQAHAQGLASRKSNMIMALVPVMSNYFFIEILSGIQDKLATQAYDLNIYNVTPDIHIAEQVEKVLRRRSAEGYLLVSTHLTDDDWENLRRYELPITLVDDYSPYFDSVSVDNKHGAYRAVKHLLSNGLRKVAILTASRTSMPVDHRMEGYKRALREFEIPFCEELVFEGDTPYRDGFTERSGYEAMIKVLTSDLEPEAGFCTSDIQAVGALKAMQDTGKFIPLVGYDDIEFAEYLGLSTVKQPMRDMGYYATQVLIDRIENPKRAVSKTIYTPDLVLRSSTENLHTIQSSTVKNEKIL